jgi:hypothetical protein
MSKTEENVTCKDTEAGIVSLYVCVYSLFLFLWRSETEG